MSELQQHISNIKDKLQVLQKQVLLHKKENERLTSSLQQMQGKEEIIFLEIQADEEIIRERVKKKREFSDADFDVYKRILQQNEPLTEPHLILQSTNDNIDEMLEKADVYLKNRE